MEFVCPLTQEIMSDPVVAGDGQTYEHSAIERYLTQSQQSPITGKLIPHTGMKNNEGVVTFPYSPKHLVLYQKFDFKPRALVAITARSLERREPAPPQKPARGVPEIKRFSTYEEGKKKGLLARLRTLTGRIYRGLDLTKEIEIVDGLALGDTLLLEKGRDLIGFAIYHTPGMSEAPQGSLYVKFLAVDARHKKTENLIALLSAIEDLAADAQLQRVLAPAYTYYWTAYQALMDRGYHIDFSMVRMKRGKVIDDEDPTALVLDDWR